VFKWMMLQAAHDRLNELKPTMQRLQKLSEELDPLESPYADVRFFDVDVEQTQQHYDVSRPPMPTLLSLLLFAGHSHGGRCGNCR
jgi:hypothetical protein